MQAREEAPESIRALYGTDQTANAVHGSDGKESAEREIEFFFPGSSVVAGPTFAGPLPVSAKDHGDGRRDFTSPVSHL